VRLKLVNRVRAGRQQLSADPSVRRRSSGHHLREQAAAFWQLLAFCVSPTSARAPAHS